MDSSDDDEDTIEAMRKSNLGGASMNTREAPENERFENGVKEHLEFEEAITHLNLNNKIGDIRLGGKSKNKQNTGDKRTGSGNPMAKR